MTLSDEQAKQADLQGATQTCTHLTLVEDRH